MAVSRNHAQTGTDKFLPALAGSLLVLGTILLLATPQPLLAVLPAGIIALMMFFGRFPQGAYFLIVFLIPFELFRTIIAGNEALTISKFVGVWLVAVLVLTGIVEKNISPRLTSNLWGLLALFFAISLMSAVLSPYPYAAWNGVRRLVTDYAVFAITLLFASSARRLCRTLPAVILTSISLSICVTFFGYAMGLEQFVHDNRSVGTATNANSYAFMLVIALPLYVHYAMRARTALTKVVAGLFAPLAILSIMLTYSRSGFLVLSVAGALLLMEHFRGFRPRYLGFLLALFTSGIIAAAFFAPEGFWSRQKTLTDTSDIAIARRLSYLRFAPEAIRSRPLIGSGPETFRELYGDSRYGTAYTSGGEEQRRRAAHNVFIEVLVSNGILGILVFLMLLQRGLANFTAANRAFIKSQRPSMAALTRTFRICYISVIASFFFISNVHSKYLWILFGLSQVTLTLSSMHQEKPAETPLPQRSTA